MPWRDIRGLGNQLRHTYERIDLSTIWNTVVDDLPALKAAKEHVLICSKKGCRDVGASLK
ncbi:MAG TPA: HepT-like ribonuclease domain-containing protein [Bryobacteraceae bacterium]|nr:HepT-like ribonuclease domain-containing protein [Bryobacteraceae bacterium]